MLQRKMLQRTTATTNSFINKIRMLQRTQMLQRTRRNTLGRRSTRGRVTFSIIVFTRERLFILFKFRCTMYKIKKKKHLYFLFLLYISCLNGCVGW